VACCEFELNDKPDVATFKAAPGVKDCADTGSHSGSNATATGGATNVTQAARNGAAAAAGVSLASLAAAALALLL
jgi:hypothetical protein